MAGLGAGPEPRTACRRAGDGRRARGSVPDARRGGAGHALRLRPADDAEFLRRAYLDLAGRIPTVSEARAFLADTRSDRRRHLVAGLLNRPSYARHFTTVWRHLLLPEADSNVQLQIFSSGFDGWLRQQFVKNVTYDAMVRDLLTTKIDQQAGRRGFDIRTIGEPTPLAYYLAKESKAENLASATARVCGRTGGSTSSAAATTR